MSDSVEIHLVVPGLEFDDTSESESNYEWDLETAITGKIKAKPVRVTTMIDNNGEQVKETTIRAGEKNPKAVIKLAENEQMISGEGIDKLELEPLYENDSGERVVGSPRLDMSEKFYVRIKTKQGQKSNYEVYLKDPAYFTVVPEQTGAKYTITSTPLGNKVGDVQWYIGSGAVVSPASGSGYDTVRLSHNKTAPYLDNTITEVHKDNLFIQMFDSHTGAVTKWEPLTVNVDTKIPVYQSYILSTTESDSDMFYDGTNVIQKGDKFFPTKGMLSFGSYFNQNVNVKVTFKDDPSGSGLTQNAKLYYGAGTLTSANNHQGNMMVPFENKKSDGTATATFSLNKVVLDKVGAVKFYAVDEAGNSSQPMELTKDSLNRWCVEAKGSNVTGPVIKTGDDYEKTVTSSTDYYSHCRAEVTGIDEISGIYGIKWSIKNPDGEVNEFEERVADRTQQIEKEVFTTAITGASGTYEVSAVVTDNAGNEVPTSNAAIFKLDDAKPVINVTNEDEFKGYVQAANVRFTVTDDASGIKYVKVVKKIDGSLSDDENNMVYEATDARNWDCYFDQVQKGIYVIVAVDNAGNESQCEVDLSNLSADIPECPSISVSPEIESKDEWYNGDEPLKVTIQRNVTATSDNTAVNTYYQMWEKGDTPYNQEIVTMPSKQITINNDGVYNFKVWNESLTHVKCPEDHRLELKVDTHGPVITYSTEKGDGTNLIVNVNISDAYSGVDVESIRVEHGEQDDDGIEIKGTQNDDGSYTGSFEIKETGDYVVIASDNAGNETEADAFTPMSMKVGAVKNITTSKATVGAVVIKGTADIKSASILYKKLADTEYRTISDDITVEDPATHNVAVSSVLEDLDSNTAYAYKITATSELGEVLEYEGYFKTLSENNAGINITGTARYADEEKTGDITVGLFQGNMCLMATEIRAGSQFEFSNVEDGNYSIVATDGLFSKTLRVLVEDGMIVYPKTSINLILSGENTSVIVTTDETPNITADNMDSLFRPETGNLSDKERELIETSSGMVEFRLYATLLRVTSVSEDEKKAMFAATNGNKIVGAYLDFSLWKYVTDDKGTTSQRVHELGAGSNISITIPLGDLAGKPGLEVVRIHKSGDNFLGRYLYDEDNNPDTYTITSNQFSTYAILYDPSPAEPEKPENKPGTTENVSEGTMNPSQNGSINTGSGTGSTEVDPDDPDDKGKKPIKPDTSTRTGGSGGSSVGSLTSSGSAKTGDAAPIGAAGGLMLISIAGFFILRKKSK